MARSYRKPMMNVEKFVANEYVAACGESGTNYYFECNAGEKRKKYDVYSTGVKDQTTGGNLLTEDGLLATRYYHPCGEKHTTNGMNDFVYGYIVDNGGVDGTYGEKTPVVIWTNGGKNVHCTTNLDISTWETVKS